MKEFQILGNKITFSTARVNYFLITMKYRNIAEKARQQLNSQYARLGNIKNVVQNLEQDAADIFMEAVNDSVDYIQQHDIYTIDYEGLLNQCTEYFTEYFSTAFENVCDQYEEIIDAQIEAVEYRKMRKNNRARFTGYGYGISGAISASIKSGAMNMATGIGHSLFNSVGNTGSEICSSVKQTALYKDQSVKDFLMNGIFLAVYQICDKVMDIIAENSDIEYETITKSEASQAQSLINNILQNKIPENKVCSAIIQALTYTPQNKELLQYTIITYGDADCSIEQMGTFFEYDLKPFKTAQIEQLFGNIEQKNYETEESLLTEKEALLQKCTEYGIAADSYLSIFDAKWQRIDQALRTVEGIEYETREIARNIEKDIETFYKRCEQFDWDAVNLLDENCRASYEAKISSIEYLEKEAFTVQIPKRLGELWKPYLYKQEIIQQLSNPETFLKCFQEIIIKQPLYQPLKNRLHFYDFAGNKKNKAPAFTSEDGIGLLFIDQTLLGGCQKGTVLTTRKLIEYDKKKDQRLFLTELTLIKPENNGFSVLCNEKGTILTLGSPTYLPDKSKQEYADLLISLISGICRTDIVPIENELSDLIKPVQSETGNPDHDVITSPPEQGNTLGKLVSIVTKALSSNTQPETATNSMLSDKQVNSENVMMPPSEQESNQTDYTSPNEQPDTIAEQSETNVQITCKNCGKLLLKGKRFCSQCGTPVATGLINSLTESVKCPTCGNKVNANKKFCSQCGTKIK